MSRRKRVATKDHPIPHRANGCPQSNGEAVDHDIDVVLVAGVDASIWQALFDGHFRLAVKCDTCGRWLTANDSKRTHRWPRCRAKAVGE